MLSKLEKKIIATIQGDIPITERPYHKLSGELGITEECFINTLTNLTNRGVIRRFGATIRHQKSGYTANVMTAWKISDPEIERIGTIMASFKEVSHCYHRNPVKEWPYNLYTMIHGKNKADCHIIVEKISKKIQVDNYSMLFSVKELKKTSMTYFCNKY